MNKHIPTVMHISSMDDTVRKNSIKNISSKLNDIFIEGIFDPAAVPYVYQLLKEYTALTGTDYKINKENTIV